MAKGSTIDTAWGALGASEDAPLADLFAGDPERLARLRVELSGMLFDFTKTHLSPALIGHFKTLADAAGLAAARENLFLGAVVNASEKRAATHVAERGSGAPADVE